MLLQKLTVNSNNKKIKKKIFDYAKTYSYCVANIILPTVQIGFVYFLVSVWDFDKNYIGQTEHLSRHLQ